MSPSDFWFLYFIFSQFVSAEMIDYCRYCGGGTHTMCKFPKPEPSSHCKGYDIMGLNQNQKRELLEMHNEIRNYVASGYENRGNPGPQPEASDMKKLKWDDELAEIAQRWASQCMTDINQRNDDCRKTARFDAGQNVVGILTVGSSSPDFRLLLSDWYNQVEYVSAGDVKNFANSEVRRIDSYTQMVWAETEYVGCGFSSFQPQLAYDNADRYHIHKLVCNYGPRGNNVGRPIYKTGKPCSSCQECDKTFQSICKDDSSEESGGIIHHFYSKFPKFFQIVKPEEHYVANSSTSSSGKSDTIEKTTPHQSETTIVQTSESTHSFQDITSEETVHNLDFEKTYDQPADSRPIGDYGSEEGHAPSIDTEEETGSSTSLLGKPTNIESTRHQETNEDARLRETTTTMVTEAKQPESHTIPANDVLTTTKKTSRLFSMIQKTFGVDESDMYSEFENIIRNIQRKADRDGADCYCYFRLSSDASTHFLPTVHYLCLISLAMGRLI